MARWGMRIRNPSTGSIQIDDQYWNLALLEKQVVTSAASQSAGATRFDLYFTATSVDPPVIAVASSDFVAFRQVTRSGNDWTFWFATKNPSQNVTIYRFGKPAALGPGWGVRIVAGGSVRWDSRQKYARIEETFSGTTLASGSTTRASGNNYAVMIASTAFHWTLNVQHLGGGNFSHQEMVRAMGVRVQDNVIAWEDISVMQKFIPGGAAGPSRIYDYLYGRYSFVVLDVTGL